MTNNKVDGSTARRIESKAAFGGLTASFTDIAIKAKKAQKAITEQWKFLELKGDQPDLSEVMARILGKHANDLSVREINILTRRILEDYRAWYPVQETERPPLADILEAWPVKVEADTRRDSQILPHMSDSAKRESLKNSDRALAIIAGKHEKPVQLELLPEPEPHEVALLNLVDGTGQPIRTSGQGAPLVSRLLISTVLAIPQETRYLGEAQFDLTLRDLVEAVYAGKWRRGEQWPQLREALRELRDIHIREREHSTLWQVVNVRRIPDEDAGLDSPIRFEAALPPGSTTGPTIDPKALAKLGLKSSPAWRAYIAAHSLTWKVGVTRVPTGQGNRRSWSRNVNSYPVLTSHDMKRLAFGDAKMNRTRSELEKPWQNIPGLVTLTDQNDPKTGVRGWRFIPESVSNRRGK
ncbi:MAG: hypothetical protein OXE82_04785 [Rhodobacter sp.]|nr:hypothetical protein [Rhodobacter sp.]